MTTCLRHVPKFPRIMPRATGYRNPFSGKNPARFGALFIFRDAEDPHGRQREYGNAVLSTD